MSVKGMMQTVLVTELKQIQPDISDAALQYVVDNFSQMFDVREILSEQNEQLQGQNAALAAQVIILTRKIFATYHNQINVSADNQRGVMDVFKDVGELFELAKTTPQQHLAEIRAEAGRAGYIAACLSWMGLKNSEGINFSDADRYAESILKGEVK